MFDEACVGANGRGNSVKRFVKRRRAEVAVRTIRLKGTSMGRSIRLLGEPAIIDDRGRIQDVRGLQTWAVLARVVLAHRPLDRRMLAAELFPEVDDQLAALRWCLASLRKALDCSACLSGDPVECRLPAETSVDVWRLEEADFDIENADTLLRGIEPKCSAEFDTWLLIERERIGGIVDARTRQDTIRALSVGDHDRAIRLAELGTRRTPFDEGNHVLLVKSLASAGLQEAALDHVTRTEKLFLEELGEQPSPALRSAARRTISSPPGGISPHTFVNSQIQFGLAALSAGAVDAGINCLRTAVGDAEKLNDVHLLAKGRLELGTALIHAVRGYDEEGAILLRQSADIAKEAGYGRIAASALRELGYVDALAGRRPSAAVFLSNALELAENDEDLAGIHAVEGFNLVDWGRLEKGIGRYELSIEHARRCGNGRREIWSLGLGAWGLLAAKRFEEADRWLTDCLRLVEEQRWIAFRPWVIAVQGESRIRQGLNPVELRSELEEAFALSCQLGDPCWEAAVARSIAMTHQATGAFAEASEWLAEAYRRCIRETDRFVALQVEILAMQAELSLLRNRGPEADAFAREWVSLAARSHMDAHVARAADFIAQSKVASASVS